MNLFKNLISNDEIKMFTNYFDKNKKHQLVNWDNERNVPLDIRLIVRPPSDEWKIIKKIIYSIAPDTISMYNAIQRQYFPHGIHIDVYDIPNPNTFTLVLALETVPEFKTIIFQEKFENKDVYKKYLNKMSDSIDQMEIKNNFSNEQDLEHTKLINEKYFLCDYLTPDGIFTYSAGDGVVFNSRKLHCSSNWVKYKKFTERNLLQIHFSTAEPHDF